MNLLTPVHLLRVAVFLLPTLLLTCCGTESETTDATPVDKTVVVHTNRDADRLNPWLSSTTTSRYVEQHIFTYLLGIDPQSLSPEPIMVVDLPEVEPITEGPYEGGTRYTYELLPQAAWDDGTPITAADYVFSLKAALNPLVAAGNLRNYFLFIRDVEIDPDNPRRFTVVTGDRYILSLNSTALALYPAQVYDPEGLLAEIPLSQFVDPDNTSRLKEMPGVRAFAEFFNSDSVSRSPQYVQGAGPYRLVEWVTNDRIVLERKADWWGDSVSKERPQLAARPPHPYKRARHGRSRSIRGRTATPAAFELTDQPRCGTPPVERRRVFSYNRRSPPASALHEGRGN